MSTFEAKARYSEAASCWVAEVYRGRERIYMRCLAWPRNSPEAAIKKAKRQVAVFERAIEKGWMS